LAVLQAKKFLFMVLDRLRQEGPIVGLSSVGRTLRTEVGVEAHPRLEELNPLDADLTVEGLLGEGQRVRHEEVDDHGPRQTLDRLFANDGQSVFDPLARTDIVVHADLLVSLGVTTNAEPAGRLVGDPLAQIVVIGSLKFRTATTLRTLGSHRSL